MDKLFMKELTLNPKKLKSLLKNSGESIIVDNTLSIVFPARYDNIGLLIISDTVKVLSSFMIINDENEYCIINKSVFITTEPSSIDTVLLEGIEYMKLTYYKGSKLVVNRNIIKDDSFVFDAFNEFYIKGNVPKFLKYEDIIDLFLSVREYNDSNISDNPLAITALTAILARDASNTTKYLRQIIKSKKDVDTKDFKFVALSSIEEGLNNSVSRFVGSRLKDGINAVLVRDEDKATSIEKILLK